MKISLRRFLMVVVFASLAMAAVPSAVWADHSWSTYHWDRTSNPLGLQLGDNLTSDWDIFLGTTSDDWNLSDVLTTAIVAGRAKSKNCKATSGRVEVCNSTYGFNGWLGLAQIWISGGHITQGISKVNDSYFNSPPYNTEAWKNLVMCQEVGHTFGLAHQDDDFSNSPLGTCMDYSVEPELNQHPNAHDYEQLEIIYGHLDQQSESKPPRGRGKNRMPPAMGEIDFDGPAQWGKLVRRSNKGHTEVYRLDFGHGHKVFTFVIWAEPRGR